MQNFKQWQEWFETAPARTVEIAWDHSGRLSATEKELVGPSIRQFQLGESSEARHLRKKALGYCKKVSDGTYYRAIDGFIAEENRHAALLGRFMDGEGIAFARRHWVDGTFRFLRHRAGLYRSLTILLTAELIAVPYYTALSDATDSKVLKAICKQILRDETWHIYFQADTLRVMATQRRGIQGAIDRRFDRVCLEGAMNVVWFSHGDVLRAGGYDFRQFRHECTERLNWVRAIVRGDLPPVLPYGQAFLTEEHAATFSLLSARTLPRDLLQPRTPRTAS